MLHNSIDDHDNLTVENISDLLYNQMDAQEIPGELRDSYDNYSGRRTTSHASNTSDEANVSDSKLSKQQCLLVLKDKLAATSRHLRRFDADIALVRAQESKRELKAASAALRQAAMIEFAAANFDDWCKQWNIPTSVIQLCNNLGASVPIDLAELDAKEIEEFILKNQLLTIEAKRFRRGYQAVVEAMNGVSSFCVIFLFL